VTDLSFMYQCGKCSRNFATPDQLKNHEIPCRGEHPGQDIDLLLGNRITKDLTDCSLKGGPSTSGLVPQRASDE
jgi:hypothetical protein